MCDFLVGDDPDGEFAGYTRAEVETAMRRAEHLSQECVRQDAEIVRCHAIIRDMLKVLHKTSVSKKDVADRGRAILGLMPGEVVL